MGFLVGTFCLAMAGLSCGSWHSAATADRLGGKRIVVPLQASTAQVSNPAQPFGSSRAVTYQAEIAVGSPAQSFTVLMDTGSPRLWIPSYDCEDDACLSHRRFVPSRSQSFEWPEGSQPLEASTSFATGTLVGEAGEDTLCLGKGEAGTENCFDMELFLAQRESSFPFEGLLFDGILGLPPARQGDITSFTSRLLSSGFSQFLLRLGHPHAKPAGELVIADGDMSESMEWAETCPESLVEQHWLVRLLSVSVGGKPVFQCPLQNRLKGALCGACRAALDSGSGYTMVPEEAFSDFWGKLQATRGCRPSEIRAMPEVVFEILGEQGPITWRLAGQDYMDTYDNECSAAFGPLSMPDGDSLWVLGQSLLRRYETLHDLSSNRLALAPCGDSCNRFQAQGSPALRAAIQRH